MTKIYLAVITGDREPSTILGVFDTLDAAQAVFSDLGHGWHYSEDHREHWQISYPTVDGGFQYTDAEVHELTLNEVKPR